MEANQTAKKIFIVDDDKLLLEMYTLKFKEKGFEVTQAFGSIDALRKLKGGIIPDVMLLDVVAPTMDGFELFALIKNEKLAPDAKAIVLSNLVQPALALKERALGVNGYVVRASANPSEVVEKVITILAEGEPLARED